jgi:hypothetical protein
MIIEPDKFKIVKHSQNLPLYAKLMVMEISQILGIEDLSVLVGRASDIVTKVVNERKRMSVFKAGHIPDILLEVNSSESATFYYLKYDNKEQRKTDIKIKLFTLVKAD